LKSPFLVGFHRKNIGALPHHMLARNGEMREALERNEAQCIE
jgi:hypothetical protein